MLHLQKRLAGLREGELLVVVVVVVVCGDGSGGSGDPVERNGVRALSGCDIRWVCGSVPNARSSTYASYDGKYYWCATGEGLLWLGCGRAIGQQCVWVRIGPVDLQRITSRNLPWKRRAEGAEGERKRE